MDRLLWPTIEVPALGAGILKQEHLWVEVLGFLEVVALIEMFVDTVVTAADRRPVSSLGRAL